MRLSNVKQMLSDEDAVSPVIGVILMVAITVILAAVIGTFVLGLGDDVTESTAPTADFDFDTDTTAGEVTVTHAGGDSIPEQELTVESSGAENGESFSATDDQVSAGDTATIDVDHEGDTVQVVWNADGADSSQILAEYDSPEFEDPDA